MIRSITVDRQNIDAGQNVTATAQVDDPDTSPSELRYEWAVTPASGTLDGNGRIGRWQSPSDDRVPASYTLTVTIIKPYVGADASGRPTSLEYRVSGTSAPIIVNDATREMKTMSEAFLAEFMDPGVAPQFCVRNFADSCGKQQALQDVASARAGYSSAMVKYEFQMFVRSVGGGNCTAADGSAACAMTIYDVQWIRRRATDGNQDSIAGTEYFNGIYAENRWWLCGSKFVSQ